MVPAPLPVPPLNSTDRMHSAQFRTSNRQHALHVAGADAYVRPQDIFVLQSVDQEVALPAVLLLAVREVRD